VVAGFLLLEEFPMTHSFSLTVNPLILRIQRLLGKIDRLKLPAASRRDVESILVRQISREIELPLPWQAGHGRRTAAIALKIGQAAGLTVDELHHLKMAALLHDIGLLMLPIELTAAPSPIESDSYVAIQNHSRLGAQLLEPFRFLQEAAVLVAHHHERWDGSGYPYGIRGTFIPVGARILAVADAFDAIRVPYENSRTSRNRIALRILLVASGTQFDPGLVSLLCHMFTAASGADNLSAEKRHEGEAVQ
jgi:response regulator RpfG family c-di-GMP phosphodiesterase